jgi:hypothetical protein
MTGFRGQGSDNRNQMAHHLKQATASAIEAEDSDLSSAFCYLPSASGTMTPET